jgi:hypothetical protein
MLARRQAAAAAASNVGGGEGGGGDRTGYSYGLGFDLKSGIGAEGVSYAVVGNSVSADDGRHSSKIVAGGGNRKSSGGLSESSSGGSGGSSGGGSDPHLLPQGPIDLPLTTTRSAADLSAAGAVDEPSVGASLAAGGEHDYSHDEDEFEKESDDDETETEEEDKFESDEDAPPPAAAALDSSTPEDASTAAAAAVATVVAAAEDAAVSTPVPPVDPFPHLLDWVQNKGRELASKWAHAAHPRTDQSQAHQVITSTLKTQDLHYPQNHRHSLPLNPETFIPTPKSRNLNPLSLNPTSSTQNPKP